MQLYKIWFGKAVVLSGENIYQLAMPGHLKNVAKFLFPLQCDFLRQSR